MKTDIYNTQGKKAGSIDLPETVFGLPWNNDLVYQTVVAMEANARTPVAHTKQRGEVRGGGKKPWKQKGTGRARHGSIRSPIWKGGGVTHGPRKEKIYSQKLNKKARAKALYTVLSQKLRDGKILFVDELAFAQPKTAEAKKALVNFAGVKGFDTIATKKKNSALIAIGTLNPGAVKSFNNMGNVATVETRNLNPVEVLRASYLVIVNPEESVKVLAARSTK
jgi:large subunit ribosomal protein L4